MWHRWLSIESFNHWHDSACAALGIPHPNRNAATGEVDEDAQWTTAYTEPVVGEDVRAVVEDDVAQLVPDGLGEPCDPPPAAELVDDDIVLRVTVGDAAFANEHLGGTWVDTPDKVGPGWVWDGEAIVPPEPEPDDDSE